MTACFPTDRLSLNSDWLTSVLRQSGFIENNRVVSFQETPVQGGYTSAIYRLELGYEAPPEDGPDSVIAKFHSESDSVRATFEHLEIY
ncbi:MAG: hypothetical protein AAF353_07475, partial [Pseudomonadota bacterium]